MRNLTLSGAVFTALFTAFFLLTLYSCDMPLEGDYRTIYLDGRDGENKTGEADKTTDGKSSAADTGEKGTAPAGTGTDGKTAAEDTEEGVVPPADDQDPHQGQNGNNSQNQYGGDPTAIEKEVQDAVEDALKDAAQKLAQGEGEVETTLSLGDAEYTITLRKDQHGADVYDVDISGLDLTNENALKGFIRGIQSGLPTKDIYLDLTNCTGAYLQPILGRPVVDKSQFVSVTLPASVKYLQDFSLSNNPWDTIPTFVGFDNLKRIAAPGITAINDYAFEDLGALEEVDFPAVETIGVAAFDGCYSLTTLKFAPDGQENKVRKIGESAFSNCSSLEVVDFPALEQFDGYNTFYRCSNLTTVKLRNLKEINQMTFEGCSSLTTLEFTPAKITAIEYAAFKECSSLREVTFPAIKEIAGSVFSGCENIERWNIPYANIESIGGYAFAGCKKLPASINFPKATSIGDYAFSNCEPLVSVTFAEVLTIGRYAFAECKNLDTVNFPKATEIQERVFDECERLVTVNISNLQVIGSAAFHGCKALAGVAFTHPGMKVIGDHAFWDCINLTGVDIPNAEQIDDNAFYNCKKLEVVDFPKVKLVGHSAFEYCSALETVKLPKVESFEINNYGGATFRSTGNGALTIYLGDEPPYVGTESFGEVGQNGKAVTIVVPTGKVDTYNNKKYDVGGEFSWEKAFAGKGSGGGGEISTAYNQSWLTFAITDTDPAAP